MHTCLGNTHDILCISPVLVTLPSAIAITTHWSAVLSGWIVQVTVMLYSSLTAGVHTSMGVALITDGTIGQEKLLKIHMYAYKHINMWPDFRNSTD